MESTANPLLRRIALFACLLAPALPFAPRAAVSAPSAPEGVVETLREGPDGFDLRITVPQPVLEAVELPGEGTFSRIRIPGFGGVGDPGHPELPVRGFAFGLPEGRVAEVSVEVLREETLRGEPPLPAPAPRVDEGAPFDIVTEDRIPDPAAYAAAGPVGSLVELGPVQGWRFHRLQTVGVSPVRVVPGTGAYTVARELVVRVRFRDGGEAPPDWRPVLADRPVFESTADRLLVNAATARTFRRRPPRVPGLLGGAQTSAASVRVRFGGTGLARLSYGDLAAAGFPAGIPVGDVRVEERGYDARQADPFLVDDLPRQVEDANGNGVFDAGDRLVFHGRNYRDRFYPRIADARYTRYHCYWVTHAAGGGRDFPVRGAEPPGPYTTLTSFPDTLHLEEDRIYINFPPDVSGQFLPQNDALYWRGPRISEFILETTFDAHDIDPAGVVSFVGAWQGVFTAFPFDQHQESVEINGQRILDKYTFAGLQARVWTSAQFSTAGLLLEGTNDLDVIGTHPPLGGGDSGLGSGAEFDYLKVIYSRLLRARSDRLAFSTGNVAAAVEMTVSGFSSADILLLDVTEPGEPVRIPGTVVDDGGSWSIRFRDDATGGRRNYLAAVPGSVEGLPPSPYILPPDLAVDGLIGPGSNRDLLAEGANADYLLVTHASMLAEFERLAQHRRDQGSTVLVATVQEIYDRFAGGDKTPEAIRNFVRRTFLDWDTPPTFLLLGGDANEDYRKDTASATTDWVPTLMHMANVPGSLRIQELAGTDAWYVQSAKPGDGNLDLVPDLYVGRLTVNSPAEARVQIDKIIAYEAMQPGDDWRNRGVFVSDDQYSTSITFDTGYCWKPGEASFASTTTEVCRRVRDAGHDFDCNEFSMSALLDTVPQLGRVPGSTSNCPSGSATQTYVRANLTPDLIATLTEGQLIWEFTGHGNYKQITTEGLILHNEFFSTRDLDKINNFGKPFIFHGYACHLAEFERAGEGEGVRSIGEVLMALPNRGAIAVVASTGYEWLHTNPAAQLYLSRPLFWDVPRDPDTRRPRRLLGESVYLGLLQCAIDFAFSPDWSEMLRTYSVLGDPALRIDFSVPGFDVTVDGTPWTDGQPLFAASFGDSFTVAAQVTDDVDVSTLAAFEGPTQLPAERLTVTAPDSTVTGARTYEVSFRTGLRLGAYDLALQATDWGGRTSSFRMPVQFETLFRADGRTLVEGPDPEANLIDSTAVVTVDVVSPAPLGPEAFTVLLDGVPLAVTPVAGDEEGRRWTVPVGDLWAGGVYEVELRVDAAGQSISASRLFQVSTDELEIRTAYFYPNPLEGNDGTFAYRLSNSAEVVELSIYTVKGRRVLHRTNRGSGNPLPDPVPGWNYIEWGGVDELGAPIGNGVYLVLLEVRGGGDDLRRMEKVAITR